MKKKLNEKIYIYIYKKTKIGLFDEALGERPKQGGRGREGLREGGSKE